MKSILVLSIVLSFQFSQATVSDECADLGLSLQRIIDSSGIGVAMANEYHQVNVVLKYIDTVRAESPKLNPAQKKLLCSFYSFLYSHIQTARGCGEDLEDRLDTKIAENNKLGCGWINVRSASNRLLSEWSDYDIEKARENIGRCKSIADIFKQYEDNIDKSGMCD